MINCGTTMFIFLQVLLLGEICQSLPDDSVNEKEITRPTQKWIQNTQWLNNNGIQLDLRLRTPTRPPTTTLTTLTTVNLVTNTLKKSTRVRTRMQRARTTVIFDSASEPCHYLVMNCLRAFQTGKICARTTYYRYMTFKNYCMMDYVNCMIRYQIWRVLHMGDCIEISILTTERKKENSWSSEVMQGIYVPFIE